MSDGGRKSHQKESGCGDVTMWSWCDDTGSGASVTFRVPPTIKAGCVGRAIGSAGGPSVSCWRVED